MKLLPCIILSIIASTAFVHSQNEETPTSSEITSARVIGEVQDGTPPEPSPPQPGFIVPKRDILETTVHEQDGRKIIVREIKPIDLPAATIEAPAAAQAGAAFHARLAAAREKSAGTELLRLGVTVYRYKDSPPRSFVSYAQGADEMPVTFWTAADFTLLAGFSSFIGSDGKTRSLLMMWSAVDIDRTAALMERSGRPYEAPVIPELPIGKATFIITSENPTAQAITSIQTIHDLYNNEHDRLKAAYESRQQANLQRAAEFKAHPPKPKNIVLNHWNIGGDAPTEGGSK